MQGWSGAVAWVRWLWYSEVTEVPLRVAALSLNPDSIVTCNSCWILLQSGFLVFENPVTPVGLWLR